MGFKLCEGHFDRIEVRAIGCRNRIHAPLALMAFSAALLFSRLSGHGTGIHPGSPRGIAERIQEYASIATIAKYIAQAKPAPMTRLNGLTVLSEVDERKILIFYRLQLSIAEGRFPPSHRLLPYQSSTMRLDLSTSTPSSIRPRSRTRSRLAIASRGHKDLKSVCFQKRGKHKASCLDLTRESRFGSRPALGTKTPTFRFYGRAKGANGNACADFGAKYNGFMRTGFARLCQAI